MKEPLPSDIFRPGQILNNTYRIEGVLGRGGTGEVYLARNEITGRTFALKALNARFSGNVEYVELMKREEEMRNIVHDSVVRYSDCSRSDAGHVFLVMDYAEGPSLHDVMLESRMTEHELLVVAHRVLEGLVATHAQGIVHRDLSPDNIILRGGAPERATIIDFGIAKDTAAGARTIVGNQFAGKYEYAAPEQLEGHAEFRTDLYALGASLLAAARGEVPRPGEAPAQVLRSKGQPLDTSGLGPRLREMIAWLAAPRLEDRPASAGEALARLDALIKPDTAGGGPTHGQRRMWPALVVVALLALAAGAAWLGGAFDRFLVTPLRVAAPFVLEATYGKEGSFLSGNAPDQEHADGLSAAFTAATGAAPAEVAIELATGMPAEDWPIRAAELMALAARLERWSLRIEDRSARLTGLAANRDTRSALRERLEGWQQTSGFALSQDIAAGPERLDATALRPMLASLATCGPLEVVGEPSDIPLFDTVTITGDLARNGDAAMLREALFPMIGDRDLRLETTLLEEDLCAIRAVLPSVPAGTLSIRLSNGATGQDNLTGVFRTGENPVVDLLMPEGQSTGSLWVMVVDNTGKAFHLLPNVYNGVDDVSELGAVEQGLRRIRILWSTRELAEDPTRLAMQITEGDYGKSEVIAILSRTPLLEQRRPRDESVRALADALEENLKGREGDILAIATRIIDARP